MDNPAQNVLQTASKAAFPTAAAIGGGTNLLASIVNNVAARKAQQRENEFNREMAEYAYSKELEMWNRQNEYNTPLAQMQRFGEAGLNPNLIYGKGTSGNATTLPKYNAPTLREKSRIPDLGGVYGSYQDAKLKQAQIDVTTNQARLLDEKVTTESVNRAQKSWNLNTWSPFRIYSGRTMHDKRVAHMDQSYITKGYQQSSAFQARELAKFNTQIAEQNLALRIKDNQSYWWRNAGAGAVRGLGNMFKFARVGGKFRKVKGAAKLPKLSVPKRFRLSNRDILPNYNF